MKAILLVLATGLVATTAGASRPLATTAPSSPLLRLPRATRAGETTLWGHVKSLKVARGRWELRFDPAVPLHGTAAEQAAFEDTGSRDVPNDVYVVDEGRRVLTFAVSRTASVTILTRGPRSTSVSVTEFSQIVAGKNPQRRRLFGEPTGFPFWIRVGTKYPNPVLSIDEQYQP